MPVFSRKLTSNEKEIKFTGAHLPLLLNSYLTLYSIANEIPKSTIILNSLQAWKKTTVQDNPIEKLIITLGEKAIETYNNLPKKGKPAFPIFINELKKELIKKGIDQEAITDLINYVENGTKD